MPVGLVVAGRVAHAPATPCLQPQDDVAGTLKFVWGQPGAFASQDAARAAFVDALKGADIIVDETYTPDPTK